MSTNRIYNIQEWQQIGIAATPSSGTSIIYPKADGNWYYMNSDGIEKIQSLSYKIGNGLTSSLASAPYNYNISVNIDNYGLTFTNNGVLSIGYITASSLSQLGNATASYILSVNSSGLPLWVPYTTQVINGVLNYVSKFSGTSSLTSSNIFDGGTYISMFTSSNSAVTPQLFVNGSIDTSRLYLNSSAATYLSSTSTLITINSQGLSVTDGTRNYLQSLRDDTNGNTFNLLNSLFQLKSLGSSNFTASLTLPTINVVGIGTATPSNLLHIYSTQPAFRLQDGSQGYGKYLISDYNGLSSWATISGVGITISGTTFSILLQSNSGLTLSNSGLGIQFVNNSGLTLSSSGIGINSTIAGFGLSYSAGQLSVTPAALSLNFSGGLVSSGGTVSINTGTGLTISSNKLILDPTIIGNGLTYSGGSISTINFLTVNGTLNYIPLFNGASSLTSSNIYQSSNNILIGTTSNIGSKLYVVGTFSFTNDGIINNINIGRGNSTTNLLFGNNALSGFTPGNYNIAIGDNSLQLTGGKDNIAIGVSSSVAITSATATVAIGNYAMSTNTTNSNAIAIGYNSGYRAGVNSISIGAYAGSSIVGNAANSIAIGFRSGNLSAGSSNIFLGYLAGTSFTGSYSVFIGGYDSNLSTSNNIFISDGQGNLRLYVPSTGNLLVGTMSDNGYKLQVVGSASFIGNLKIIDGTQAKGKILISDDNGITTWVMPSGIGMTISGYTFSVLLQNNSGLTVSSNGLGVTIQSNSGLTISSSGLTINSSIAGYGLTFSSGSMSFTTNINAAQGYIPYFNTTTSLTSSVIYQTSSNILVATTSNDGATLQIAGSASIYGKLKIADGTQALNKLLISDGNGLASWATASTILGPNFFLQGGNSFGATATLGTNDNRNMQVIAGGNNIMLFATSSITLNVPIQYSNSLSSSASLNNNGVIVTNTTNGANGIGINAASAGNPNLTFYINNAAKAGIGYSNISGVKGLGLVNLTAASAYFQLFLDDFGNLQWTDGNNNLRWIVTNNGAITQSVAQLSGALSTSAYSITQTWNTTGTPTAIKLNITDTSSATASLFLDLQKNSVSQFNVDKNGNTTVKGSLILNSTITDISGLTGPNNYVLSATTGGVKWVVSAPNNVVKYSGTQSFSASVPYVINHNLNTQFYIIQLFDYPTGDEIMGSYTNRGLTQATITLSSNVSNAGIIIMG